MNTITLTLQQRYREIIRNLNSLGNREGNFTRVELLFFEVLSLARNEGNTEGSNSLLQALKNIQSEQYQKTKTATKKPAERERNIRSFMVRLKKVLSGYC